MLSTSITTTNPTILTNISTAILTNAINRIHPSIIAINNTIAAVKSNPINAATVRSFHYQRSINKSITANRTITSLTAGSVSTSNTSIRYYRSNNSDNYAGSGTSGNQYSYLPAPASGRINYGIVIVPQQSAYVIERFGKFSRVLDPGLHFLVPIVDKIAYVHNLKEQAISVSNQQAITMDNVTISIDGVLYVKLLNPMLASYGVADIYYAMVQLAQTTMRSELGKITLDKTFAERESLNANIVRSINAAAEPWGCYCLRYEIRDITPPLSIRNAMDSQAEAERKKRATILDSEGSQQASINVAQGHKQATVLNAQAEAAAILARAEATAQSIQLLAQSIGQSSGREAVALRIAEQYIEAFSGLAQSTNTMILPADAANPASMITQAMAIYSNTIKSTQKSLNNNSINQQQSSSSDSELNNLLTSDFNPATGQINKK